MILNIRYDLHRGDDDQKGQIYDKLYNLLSMFYSNPLHSLDSVSINISFIKTNDNKRHFMYLLKTQLQSEEDIRAIIYFIDDHCRLKGIEFTSIDRIFVRASISRIPG